jgi:hypothetical protein
VTQASPLAEPRAQPLAHWQRRALARLADTGRVAWTDITGPDGLRGPKHRHVRRFMRALEDGGAVHHDHYHNTFLATDVPALARLLRWDGKGSLTAALRAGRVAGSAAVAARDTSRPDPADASRPAASHPSAVPAFPVIPANPVRALW